MAKVLKLRLKGRRFDSRPYRFQVGPKTLGKLFTHVCLVPSSILYKLVNLYGSKGGDVLRLEG